MKLDYFHTVMLFCINQFNGERTVSAIYHLLNGKKSSQTIQDGKLFNLTHMFGLFPKLSRLQMNDSFHFIQKEGFIKETSESKYQLTHEGQIAIKENLNQKPIPASLNGWKYGDLSRIFWRRLSLLVQVLSNFNYGKKDYLPVTKNQEDLYWVKMFLHEVNDSKHDLSDRLYDELSRSLQSFSDKQAAIFVQRLSSSQKIGLTFEQIAYKHDEDPIYTYLIFWDVLHSILQFLQTNKTEYTIFNEMLKDKRKTIGLTASTKKTMIFLLEGKSISEIAHLRRLKESTIEDHIVEITLHDQEYIPSRFLNEEDYKKIDHAIRKLETHQLRKVKEYLNDEYSYFQIRLTYALSGREESFKS